MGIKRLATGTIAGGILMFAVRYIVFDLAFGNFYATNVGSATGVNRDTQLVWAIVPGSLS